MCSVIIFKLFFIFSIWLRSGDYDLCMISDASSLTEVISGVTPIQSDPDPDPTFRV